MTALFVSDLHLDPGRPEATDCFLRFMAGEAMHAKALYVLGDLFEAWIGDDAAGEHERDVMAALRRAHDAGVRVGFIRGNRDFLTGRGFARASGAEILPDESLVSLTGQRVLLMHGDSLCTDDRAYQRFRRVVRHPVTDTLFRALPLGTRRRVARWTRGRSQAAIRVKPESIMDVNAGAVESAMRRHNVRTLIHGHTHRPAVHRFELDGQPALRIVLGDWYEQGSVLRWDADGPRLDVLN